MWPKIGLAWHSSKKHLLVYSSWKFVFWPYNSHIFKPKNNSKYTWHELECTFKLNWIVCPNNGLALFAITWSKAPSEIAVLLPNVHPHLQKNHYLVFGKNIFTFVHFNQQPHLQFYEACRPKYLSLGYTNLFKLHLATRIQLEITQLT
jgi:hypothetical protein